MIHPVILCGGSGTRLWPLSRRDFPKQFTRILGDESLFQTSVRRHVAPGFAAPTIIAHSDFRFLAAEQLAELEVTPSAILLEPQARNTAPAILAAALTLEAAGHGEDVMLVAPSDHVIRDQEAYHAAVASGAAAAAAGGLVTFGLRPDRAETGYGYLELAAPPEAFGGAALDVVRFVEKPDADRAATMVADGRYLWNAGIFMFRVATIVEVMARLVPEMYAACRAAVDDAQADLDFHRLDPTGFAAAPEDSIDYAVMERADGVVTVPVDCGWSDMGAWDAVWREMARDAAGLATRGDVTAIGCRQTLLRSEENGPHLVGINLDNIVAIAMNDAVMVADMSDLQAVKTAVTTLRAAGVAQAETFPRTYRPWGWYETLALDGRFQVKQIMVPPGRKLSLQSHVHRSEHWIVVKGTALVTIDDTEQLVTENQSVYIPLGAVHRLENPGKVDLHLIEVQTGSYLGEDDIVRYDDIYNRT